MTARNIRLDKNGKRRPPLKKELRDYIAEVGICTSTNYELMVQFDVAEKTYVSGIIRKLVAEGEIIRDFQDVPGQSARRILKHVSVL